MSNLLSKYYKALGLAPGASQKDIKKAYFKLAKKYHPDVNPSVGAKRKFIEVNKAYEILSNPELVKRALQKFYYSRKKKKAATRRKATNIKKKTTRRASTPKNSFNKKTAREILRNDLRRILSYFLGIHVFFMVPSLMLGSNENTASEFLIFVLTVHGWVALVTGLILIMPLVGVIDFYLRTKKKSNSKN